MPTRRSSLAGIHRVDLSTKLKAMPRLASVLERTVSLGSRPLHGRVVTIPSGAAAGLRFRIGPVGTVWVSGRMEPRVQQTLRAIIRPGDVFLDIGANVGFFTILGARLVGESGSVVAFEPEPENVVALRDNVALNGFANVTVVAAAVSSSIGTALLSVPHRATARLLPEDSGDQTAPQVAMTSIDGYLSRHPGLEPAVIKLDVEGHEVAVIDGMRETLARWRPTVLCELHRTNVEVGAAFDRAGYRTAVLGKPGSIDEAPWWAHVVAEPRG